MCWQLTPTSTWESSEGKGLPLVCSRACWANSYKNRGSKLKRFSRLQDSADSFEQCAMKNWFRQTLIEMFRNKIKAGGTNWLNPEFLQLLVNSPIQKTSEKDTLNKAKGPCQPSSKLSKHTNYLVRSPFFLLEKYIYTVNQRKNIPDFRKRDGGRSLYLHEAVIDFHALHTVWDTCSENYRL